MVAIPKDTNESTSARGTRCEPTFVATLGDYVRHGKLPVHFYAPRKDGAMICCGCRLPIIQTPVGEPARQVGEPIRWNETPCNGGLK